MPQTQQNSNCTFEHQMTHRHSCLVNYFKTFVTLRWNFIPFAVESRIGANIPLPPLSNFVSENTRFKDLDIFRSIFDDVFIVKSFFQLQN